ncbi:hypothetical protein TNCV_29831 [Trichonephila clavipes]|nr:hypothetical protein TNCV_29831 [Trichonephila clavipes]
MGYGSVSETVGRTSLGGRDNPTRGKVTVAKWSRSRTHGRRVLSWSPGVAEDPPRRRGPMDVISLETISPPIGVVGKIEGGISQFVPTTQRRLRTSDHNHSVIVAYSCEGSVAYIAVMSCQVIYSQFGLAIHQNDFQARPRFVEWAQNEIAVVPDFHKRILFSDEAHFWLNGYVNKQNCRIWSEANPLVYIETPLHPEKLIVWGALWAGGILLQKR